MEVRIDKVTQEKFLDPFGITASEVEEAVRKEDSKRVLHYADFIVILFLKKMDKGYYLLVDGRWHDSVLFVSTAFKIFPHTLETLRSNDPLIVLQHFAQTFGYTMIIGEQLNRFVYSATISVPRRDDWQVYLTDPSKRIRLQDFVVGRGEEAIGTHLVRFRRGVDNEENDYIDVGLAYSVNSLRYIVYINENAPGTVPVPPHLHD